MIPTLGSLDKGIIKVAPGKAAKMDEMLEIYNHFTKGNGAYWLREFAQKLPTEHVAAAARNLEELLARAALYLQKARDGWFISVLPDLASAASYRKDG
jgi:hypothetical protein